MATLLQVAHLGHPVLRQKAKRIRDVHTKKIQQLIDNLIDTVKDVSGVGIAAPQVYQSIRLFIVASHPNPRYPHAPKMKPTPMVNPKILTHSKEMEKDWEGCLSIPGIRGFVPRFSWIQIEYLDRSGKLQKKKFKDFIARIVQHEYDHLDGIMFLDRVDSSLDLISEKEFGRLIMKKK